MTLREGRYLGPRRDIRKSIIAVLRQATEPLTTPQIIVLARLSRNAAFRHLTDLEREGLVKRLGEGSGGGGAHRWYWRPIWTRWWQTDGDERGRSASRGTAALGLT